MLDTCTNVFVLSRKVNRCIVSLWPLCLHSLWYSSCFRLYACFDRGWSEQWSSSVMAMSRCQKFDIQTSLYPIIDFRVQFYVNRSHTTSPPSKLTDLHFLDKALQCSPQMHATDLDTADSSDVHVDPLLHGTSLQIVDLYRHAVFRRRAACM